MITISLQLVHSHYFLCISLFEIQKCPSKLQNFPGMSFLNSTYFPDLGIRWGYKVYKIIHLCNMFIIFLYFIFKWNSIIIFCRLGFLIHTVGAIGTLNGFIFSKILSLVVGFKHSLIRTEKSEIVQHIRDNHWAALV